MVKRKIPARKHHGVRDPLRQQAAVLAKIKHKINNPPEKGDQQKIPYKLAQLIKVKNDVKSGKVVKLKRVIGNEDKPKNIRNKIKPVKKLSDETDESYLKRLNRITTQSLKEAEYEVKYGVEVHRNPKTGEIKIKKKPKDELEQSSKRRKPIAKKSGVDPKVAKELIKQVLNEEKQKKSVVEEYKKDNIRFGEIVHAPPTLTAVPRKAVKNETVPRPGRKNLLLKSLIGNKSEEDSPVNRKVKDSTAVGTSSNLKGKRKELSHAARRMIETEQNKVVELYRQMKKKKINI